MKKFLVPLLLALALLLPTAISEAADVPDFRSVAGNNVTFTGKEVTGSGYVVYGYDCSVDMNENFAEQYMRSLMNNYPFYYSDHFLNDYRKTSAELFENWIFGYSGSKNISTFAMKDHKTKTVYRAHLVVRRHPNWQNGITHFAIYIANGLTYGGD